MQLHLDFTVSSVTELHRQRGIAESLAAAVLLDQTDQPDEPLFVFADLSGHPFCTSSLSARRTAALNRTAARSGAQSSAMGSVVPS